MNLVLKFRVLKEFKLNQFTLCLHMSLYYSHRRKNPNEGGLFPLI